MDEIQRLFSLAPPYTTGLEGELPDKEAQICKTSKSADANRNSWLWLYFLKSKRVISKWEVEGGGGNGRKQ